MLFFQSEHLQTFFSINLRVILGFSAILIISCNLMTLLFISGPIPTYGNKFTCYPPSGTGSIRCSRYVLFPIHFGEN
ncbi:hypothetical protein AYI68_g6387 [Smittium mucronatum]|uniref:Uncharacterized protein n=1 Tax=Smittium mucronatum TaxID=133383 RepID=A0A1R0GRN6_9FUNG|nr:hypothetical protein AYI68_g6387 [Smittium mucronatum]